MAEIGNRMAYRIEQQENGAGRFRTIARFALLPDGEVALHAFTKAYPDDTFRLYANNGMLMAESY